MILAHPQLDSIIELSGERIATMVVENPDFYRELLCDLYDQQQGRAGKLILSENGVTLPIGKWVELVDNCLSFDLNRKPLLNRLCAALEQTAVSEDFFLKTSDLLCRLEAYMEELSFAFPCDIVCEKCTVSGLIKGVGVSLRDDYADPLERLVDFMELVREFDRDRLFVLVGLRSLFADAAVESFLHTVAHHGYHVLLLDCVDRQRLSLERRLTIDKDLCEF